MNTLSRFFENKIVNTLLQVVVTLVAIGMFGLTLFFLLRDNPQLTGYIAKKISAPAGMTILYAALACAALFLLYLLHARYRKGQYLLVLLPVLVILSGKLVALCSILLFLGASLALGLYIFKLLKMRLYDTILSMTHLLLALAFGMGVNGMIIWGAMHFPVNVPLVYYAFLLVEVAVFGMLLLAELRGSVVFRNIDISWGQYVIILASIALVFYALVPFYLWDDLIRHLTVPKIVSLYGFFDFHPSYTPALDLGLIPQSSYVAVYQLDGEYAIRLINFAMFFLSLLLLEDCIRRKYNDTAALFSVLICVTTPFVLWILGVVFLDTFCLFGAVSMFVMFMATIDDMAHNRIFILFGLAVFALLSKLQNVYLVIPIFTILTYEVFIAKYLIGKKNYIASFMLGSLFCVALLAAVLYHNYVISGNPLFPFYNLVFKSQWYALSNFKDTRWDQPLGLKTLYDITFHGSKYLENINYSFGFTYFMFGVFIPFAFIMKKRLRENIHLIVILFVSIVLWFKTTGPYMRYFVSCMPVASLVVGNSLHELLQFVRIKLLKGILIGIIAFIFLINAVLLFSVNNVATPYPIREAFSDDYSRSSIVHNQNIKKIFTHASKVFSKNDKCLLIELPNLYFADCRVATLYWYNDRIASDVLGATGNIDKLLDMIFNKHGFTFILMPEKAGNPVFAVFNSDAFRNRLTLVHSENGYCIFTRK